MLTMQVNDDLETMILSPPNGLHEVVNLALNKGFTT